MNVFSDERLQVLQIFWLKKTRVVKYADGVFMYILKVGFVAGERGKVEIPSDRNATECILTGDTTGL